ncbi:hypothetical protein LPJ66_000086 [Kickxella alabastrina]|uniref:Uncharacterized protein n=1 Tax=Kickxella alabastrina TaxID=61397 RepID=A0ACC1IWZ6_9FUNG|nr:hypothetical protein LPJ66_000086 [Kickxella alabastrina]
MSNFNIALGGADKTDARTVPFVADCVANTDNLTDLRDEFGVQFERNRQVGHQGLDIGDVEWVHGQKEDLKAQVIELGHALLVVEQAAPYAAPDKKIKWLRRDAEAKKGSLKTLCISRYVIRLSTKTEIMSIQERCTCEQAKLINRKEKMAWHCCLLESRKANLKQEQLMQMEMNSGMRTTQLANRISNLTAALADMAVKYSAARGCVHLLEDAAKTLTS